MEKRERSWEEIIAHRGNPIASEEYQAERRALDSGRALGEGVELYGTAQEDREIVSGFSEWAEGFAEPDEALSEGLLGEGLSPRQLAHEVREHTPIGRKQVQSLHRMAERLHESPILVLNQLREAHFAQVRKNGVGK